MVEKMKRYVDYLRRLAGIALLPLVVAACESGDGDDATPLPEPPKQIEVSASSDLYGFIGDSAGNPLEGVVVSDGYQCVATNAEGVYEMKRHSAAEYVYYSTPSTCKIKLGGDRYPDFYARLNTSQTRIRQDFTLDLLAAPETNFRLICIGDPQPASTGEVTRFSRESMTAVNRTVSASAVPCYGVALGDLTGEKPDLLASVRRTLGEANMPVFAVPGNHDKYKVDDATPRDVSYYSYVMGPVDFSFNRGDVHVVCMDDVIYTSGTSYTGGFTDEQLAWLKDDLSFVPKDRMVILCYHIPLRGGTARNMAAVKALLGEYAEAHLMCGHTHYSENYINDAAAGKYLYEHIHAAPCGVWWHSTLNADGCPNGYALYEVNGATITDWCYKSCLHDEEFQIRLHRGGDTHSGFTYPYTSDVVIANVWNADPQWKVWLYEDGRESKRMQMISPYISDAWAVGYHVGVLGRGDNYKSQCKHLFMASPDNPRAALKVVAVDRWGNRYEQDTFTAPGDFTEAIAPVY